MLEHFCSCMSSSSWRTSQDKIGFNVVASLDVCNVFPYHFVPSTNPQCVCRTLQEPNVTCSGLTASPCSSNHHEFSCKMCLLECWHQYLADTDVFRLPSSQKSGPIIVYSLPVWHDELLGQCWAALCFPELSAYHCIMPIPSGALEHALDASSRFSIFCLCYKAAGQKTRSYLWMTVIGWGL